MIRPCFARLELTSSLDPIRIDRENSQIGHGTGTRERDVSDVKLFDSAIRIIRTQRLAHPVVFRDAPQKATSWTRMHIDPRTRRTNPATSLRKAASRSRPVSPNRGPRRSTE